MKIRPVILCGGAGTRLWPNSKNHQAKQFIDFGNWTLLGKTLERVKASIFDAPIISTNAKYLRQVKQHLKKHKIRKFKIIEVPGVFEIPVVISKNIKKYDAFIALLKIFIFSIKWSAVKNIKG